MSQQGNQPKINVVEDASYREIYANSVQVRVSVWDFCLVFGTARQESQDAVTVQNLQGIYLSPQQAKALYNVLNQNLSQYEQAFGEIAIEPKHAFPTNGPVH
ncbi:MAG TPA: DUF3467 domain-containing protein [Acidobacteriaceae bacterium]|jgi:flagellar protein FlaG|nr:DUF3467 domain-containing protein [Acidobacteriaceae bacterium]